MDPEFKRTLVENPTEVLGIPVEILNIISVFYDKYDLERRRSRAIFSLLSELSIEELKCLLKCLEGEEASVVSSFFLRLESLERGDYKDFMKILNEVEKESYEKRSGETATKEMERERSKMERNLKRLAGILPEFRTGLFDPESVTKLFEESPDKIGGLIDGICTFFSHSRLFE
ncbi:MAG: hypothetical protein LBC61_05815 [Candidatus Peribacteria bacterium]|jgi:hypothetical protein|nr:hypothetical protein [Candidatus Peribacteria bacterium]